MISTEPQRCPFRAVKSLDLPSRGQRALKEPSLVTSPGPSCAVIAAACCLQTFPTAVTAVGKRVKFTSSWEDCGAAAFRTSKLTKKNYSVADRRPAFEKSLRPHGQRFHQHSHDRTRGRSSAGFSRVPEELDHSLDPTVFWLRYTPSSV